MKPASILACTALAVLAGACSGHGRQPGNASPAAEVSNFEIRETLKSASQSYRLVYAEGDTSYLTISATIQWPEKLGDKSLLPLQDSLINTLATKAPYSIDQAISAYVSDPDMVTDHGATPDYTASAVDSVPLTTEAVLALEVSTTARVLELTEQTVTYQVYYYSFTGGPHPNYAYAPFTYDLEDGKILTFDNLFRKGCDQKLLAAVQEALANQLGVTGASGLSRAGIFMDQMFLSNDVYISDGQIVFHYNPYEIGPYSLGAVDVTIAPMVVEEMLTPRAKQLLLD